MVTKITDLINYFFTRFMQTRVANNLLTKAEGYVLDARQGAELKRQFDEIRSVANALTGRYTYKMGAAGPSDATTKLLEKKIPGGGFLAINVKVDVYLKKGASCILAIWSPDTTILDARITFTNSIGWDSNIAQTLHYAGFVEKGTTVVVSMWPMQNGSTTASGEVYSNLELS